MADFKIFGRQRMAPQTPDELQAIRQDQEARIAEKAKQRELRDKLIRAGSKGLIQELGLSKILPVDVAMRKRSAQVAKRLREASTSKITTLAISIT
jgi:hypothetical protein